MIIENVLVYSEDKKFTKGNIVIENGLFADASEDGAVVDGQGCYAIPGLVDVHFHGCVGADFCDGTVEAIQTIAEYEASQGVTTIVPATMTLPEEELMGIMKSAADYIEEERNGASLSGINMEGPFISAAKKGAQAATHIRKPDADMFRRLQQTSNGLIRLCDIAPEEEGAMEFIAELKDEVNISFAHTTASYDVAKKGYDMGANHATHLYNAMPAFAHRDPGVIGAARDSGHVYVELICDGIHIHPSTVRATFEMFGDDRIVMISDSMRASGLSDGEYTLGGQAVKVTGKLATLVSDGAIAGSCVNLMECVRTAVKEMGIPLESAVACATMNAAKSVGLYDECGSITVGKRADVVLLDRELNLKKVIIKGKVY